MRENHIFIKTAHNSLARTTIILLLLVSICCTAISLRAEMDDDFSHLEGLKMYRLADKELDNYLYESARYQYENILNGLSPADTLKRIYGLSKLAKTSRRIYHLDEAWDLISEATALAQLFFKEAHPVQGYLYHERGELASFSNRFVDAEQSLLKALEIRTKLYGRDGCITAFTVKELGEFYFFFIKDYARAEPLIRESFNALDACISGNTYGKALAYYDLSCVYWRNLEGAKANQLAEAALDILLNCPVVNWDFVPNAYNLLAIIARTVGNVDLAIEYSIKALNVREIYRPDNKERIVSETYHLASYQAQSGKLDEALTSLNKAMGIYKASQLNNDDVYASMLLSYGDIYGKQGKKALCMRFYNQGLRAVKNLYGDCEFTPLIHYSFYANSLAEFAERDSAFACQDYVISCLENSQFNDKEYAVTLLAEVYAAKGELYYRDGIRQQNPEDLKNALEMFAKSDSVIRIMKSLINYNTSVLEINETFQQMYHHAVVVAHELSQQEDGEVYRHMAYDMIESNKSYLLFKSIIKNQLLMREGLPESLKQQLLETDGRMQLLKIDTVKANKLQNLSELELLTQKRKSILRLIDSTNYQRERVDVARGIPALEECVAEMGKNDCILQYFKSDQGYYLLGITREGSLFQYLGHLDSLRSLIALLGQPPKASNTYRSDVKYLESLSHMLYRQLIPESFIRGKDLVVIPDGALYHFPFEALVTEISDAGEYADLHYLVKSQNLSYAYSGAQYLKMRAVRLPTNYSLYGVFPKEDLANAAKERKVIERQFRNVELADYRDDKSTVIDKLRNRAVIHFATHGKADSVQRDANYLELYEETKLYDYEISTLLLNSRLVYLNACETNLGQESTGEGVFSMSKAFMQAGCPTVISSLWEIPDEASSKLAENFYKEIYQKHELDASFALSKRKYIEEASGILAHPYYWSGVLLIGNDQPIVLKTNNSLPLIKGIGAGVLFLTVCFGVSRWRRGKYSPSHQ